MNDTREDEMRDTALHLAAQSTGSSTLINGSPPQEVVARARVYFYFLNGDKETPAEADHG